MVHLSIEMFSAFAAEITIFCYLRNAGPVVLMLDYLRAFPELRGRRCFSIREYQRGRRRPNQYFVPHLCCICRLRPDCHSVERYPSPRTKLTNAVDARAKILSSPDRLTAGRCTARCQARGPARLPLEVMTSAKPLRRDMLSFFTEDLSRTGTG